MPVTTRPSPERFGWLKDRLVPPGNLSRPLLDIVSEGCKSPYENDPRKPPMQWDDSVPTWTRRYAHEAWKKLPLLGSSFDSWTSERAIAPYGTGFVDALVRAFNQDLHLVLRPDDVWLAILGQFSLFVNGNAELVRRFFVEHDGKKTLTVDMTPFGLGQVDLGHIAQQMASVVHENVVDKSLRDWMTPNFSTTTNADRSVSAFVMMGTLQKYFEYFVRLGCGFPSVTLQGERADWADLARRIDKLPEYSADCAHWATLLRVVARHFLLTFDEPESQAVKDFWLRCAHKAGSEGSGMGLETLSGWITAFAVFDEDGKLVKTFSDQELGSRDTLYGMKPTTLEDRGRLVLDGIEFPIVRPASMAKSVITVPMTIRDEAAGVDRFTTVIAGSIGASVSQDKATVQPLSGWWVIQEFEQPIGNVASPGPSGRSVTGSTTDGVSEAGLSAKKWWEG